MALLPPSPLYSRRKFLHQLLGVGALTVTGLDSLFAQVPTAPLIGVKPFRFAFLTDLHLMKDGDLRSADGIAACLSAVEKLDPRPEFILVGGDLVHTARDLTIPEAEQQYNLFLKIWNDHTALPTHWTFGNHDLAGTSNPGVSPQEKFYGKALFEDRFKMPRLFYSFDANGWHFIVLDDIALQPDRSYIGKFFDDELAFLKADLDAHQNIPTIVCAHIPALSLLPSGLLLAHSSEPQYHLPKSLVCTNADKLFQDIPRHNIRAVLAGHLHRFEKLEMNGVHFINSGAVCGNYWKGPASGCLEGFGVVDLGADGTVTFDYRNYGWKA